VTCDQASHIHLLKHRIGVSINAESARYKELKEDKFYLPEDWAGIDMDEDSDWRHHLQWYTELGNKLYHRALAELTPVLGRKRAKESARFFKTINSQITMDVMFNWRSFMHFQGLRNSEHAQLEIREIAQQMLSLVQNIPGNPFEHSLKAFGYDSK
jgi:flavin-dependent thymidylate synthase